MHKACLFLVLFLALLDFGSARAYAHAPGENYVFLALTENGIDGRFEFRYDELKEKLGIDVMENGIASLERLKASVPQVTAYINRGFSGPWMGRRMSSSFSNPPCSI